MFDDPAQEISDLSLLLKQDIQTLNAQIADLQSWCDRHTNGNKQSASHTTTVVDNLRTRLKDTAKEFSDVLTLRSENLKAQTDRRNLFAAPPERSRSRAGRQNARNASNEHKRRESIIYACHMLLLGIK